MSKHTQRTLKHYRDQGYIGDVIERWIIIPGIPGKGKRRDYLGFADILFFKPDEPDVLLIQSCGQSYAEHLRKILEAPLASEWVRMDNRRLIMMAWRKLLKKRGGKLKIWVPRIKEFTLEDFEEHKQTPAPVPEDKTPAVNPK